MVWGVCLCAAVMTNSRLLLGKCRNSAKQVPLGDCGATEEERQQTMRAWNMCSCNMMCIFQFSFTTVSCKGAALNILPKGLWNQRCDPFFGASGKKTGYREAHSLGLWFSFMQVYGEKKHSVWWMSFFPYPVSFPVQMSSCLRLYRPRIKVWLSIIWLHYPPHKMLRLVSTSL